jgi:hypothetical protein
LLLAISQVVGPLPLTWLDFHAVRKDEVIELHWNTANERDNLFFSVERSTDGYTFYEVGKVKPNESANTKNEYAFYDTQDLAKAVYYRIKQLDSDGKYSYSSIAFVNADASSTLLFEVYPNPSLSGEINVHFTSEVVALELIDVLGKSIYSIALTKDHTSIKLTGIIPGVYILSAIANGKSFQEKVVVH